MNCKKCGGVLHDDDIFCQNCGTKIENTDDAEVKAEEQEAENKPAAEAAAKEEPAAQKPAETMAAEKTETQSNAYDAVSSYDSAENYSAEASTSSGGLGKLINPVTVSICAVVILLAAIIFVFAMLSNKSMSQNEGVVCINDMNENIYILDNGKVVEKITGNTLSYEYSMDLSSGAVLTEDQSLYYFNSKKTQKIASDVSDSFIFHVSDNGSSVLYVKDDILYLYKASENKSERLAEDPNDYTLSANGNAVLYTVYDSDGDTECYFYNNGKSTKIDGKNIQPLAIADNAKYVYYTKLNDDYTNSLYVYSGNDSTKLTSTCYTYGIWLNRDRSEILYFNDKGTYISEDGKEGQKIFSGSLSQLVTPYNGIGLSRNVYDVDTFRNKAFFSYDTDKYSYDIRYVAFSKKEWSAEKLAADISGAYTSGNLKSIIYLKKNKLYYIKNLKDGNNNAVDLADDIDTFIPSDDLKYCYAIDEDSALYYIDSKNSKKISDDIAVEDYDDGCWGRNVEGNVFFVSDDVLYTAYKNGAREKINGNPSYLISDNNCLFYVEEDDDIINIYANTKGTKFECFIKDMDMDLLSNTSTSISVANSNAKLAFTNAATYCTKCAVKGYDVPSGWYFCDLKGEVDSSDLNYDGKDLEAAMQYLMGGTNNAGYALVHIGYYNSVDHALWSSRSKLQSLDTDALSDNMQCTSSMIIGSYPYVTTLGDTSTFSFNTF